MESIKRYKLVEGAYGRHLSEGDNGGYVKYSDHEKLIESIRNSIYRKDLFTLNGVDYKAIHAIAKECGVCKVRLAEALIKGVPIEDAVSYRFNLIVWGGVEYHLREIKEMYASRGYRTPKNVMIKEMAFASGINCKTLEGRKWRGFSLSKSLKKPKGMQ